VQAYGPAVQTHINRRSINGFSASGKFKIYRNKEVAAPAINEKDETATSWIAAPSWTTATSRIAASPGSVTVSALTTF
jgi:hypothetical protein